MNFFHSHIVLASHPYVRKDQQEDAESYFRGLNFVEVKRIRAGGGQIIVMDQRTVNAGQAGQFFLELFDAERLFACVTLA